MSMCSPSVFIVHMHRRLQAFNHKATHHRNSTHTFLVCGTNHKQTHESLLHNMKLNYAWPSKITLTPLLHMFLTIHSLFQQHSLACSCHSTIQPQTTQPTHSMSPTPCCCTSEEHNRALSSLLGLRGMQHT